MLEVEVQPGAKRQGILGFNEWRGRLTVAVRAEAQKGKANNAVLHVLSTSLQIPKINCRSSVELRQEVRKCVSKMYLQTH